jgi:mono/diheme cytochrome c family protein
MTGGQVRSVLAFLQATNTDPGQAVPLPTGERKARVPSTVPEGAASTNPEVIARGKDLVDQKACLGCHVVGSAGGQVGPSLNGVVGRRGPTYLRRKMADPTFDSSTSMMPNFGLTSEEVEAILAYINTFNGGSK